jgi:hypothetical protein
VERREYVAPELHDLGSLQDLTAQLYNKIGPTPDTYSTNPDIVGSVVQFP